MAVGALAGAMALLSIGEAIFEFKGVVLKLIAFYREAVSPLYSFLDRIFRLSRIDVDIFVFGCVYWASISRVQLARKQHWLKRIIKSLVFFLFYMFITVILLIVVNWIAALVFIAITFLGLVAGAIGGPTIPETHQGEDMMAIETLLVTVFLTLLIIAISEGLTRPLQ